jgi:hypothetical protein
MVTQVSPRGGIDALRDRGPIGRYIAATRGHLSASELAADPLPQQLEREFWAEVRPALKREGRRR